MSEEESEERRIITVEIPDECTCYYIVLGSYFRCRLKFRHSGDHKMSSNLFPDDLHTIRQNATGLQDHLDSVGAFNIEIKRRDEH